MDNYEKNDNIKKNVEKIDREMKKKFARPKECVTFATVVTAPH